MNASAPYTAPVIEYKKNTLFFILPFGILLLLFGALVTGHLDDRLQKHAFFASGSATFAHWNTETFLNNHSLSKLFEFESHKAYAAGDNRLKIKNKKPPEVSMRTEETDSGKAASVVHSRLLKQKAYLHEAVKAENESHQSSVSIPNDLSAYGAKVIPKKFLSVYQRAAAKYDVPWNLIAAVHRVETNFSKNLQVSSAGAIGPTQFMTCTWVGWSYSGCGGLGDAEMPQQVLTDPDVIKKYGGYGVDGDGDGKADPMDLQDAIYSTANYLAANGADSGKIRQAVHAYNHSSAYVHDVLRFADHFSA
ncbi:MAG TPA: lytic transglycosylase domain-containing protein [Bacillales bacterium]|nr:lytic transglycosylase domain-containing protein [Bacillales bacterium]